jgi:hypothetical protein
MKADKNYRMSQHVKRLLAGIDNCHDRGRIARAFISAELISQRATRSRGNNNPKDQND